MQKEGSIKGRKSSKLRRDWSWMTRRRWLKIQSGVKSPCIYRTGALNVAEETTTLWISRCLHHTHKKKTPFSKKQMLFTINLHIPTWVVLCLHGVIANCTGLQASNCEAAPWQQRRLQQNEFFFRFFLLNWANQRARMPHRCLGTLGAIARCWTTWAKEGRGSGSEPGQ